MTSHQQGPESAVPFAAGDASAIAGEEYAVAASAKEAVGYRPPPLKRWSGGYMTLLFVAMFTLYIAQLAPSSYSLAVRIEAIAPADKDTLLALVLTIPAICVIFVNPIVGILSDRTRSPLGRRRPWMIGGLAAGLIGLVTIGVAPGIPLIVVGWTVGYLGLTTTSSMVITHLGDALPKEQRGKVAGINGAVTQIAPIAGVLLSATLVHMPILLFAVPGIIAVLGAIAFLVRINDPSTKHVTFEHVSIGGVFSRMVFNPRKHKDFAWAWISKALTFVGLYMMSIYTVYFLGARLGMGVGAVAGLVATVGGIGVFITMGGALGSGFLTDKIHRRKPLLVAAGVVIAAGLIITAVCTTPLQFIIGASVSALGSGAFGAIDQALSLDVLPDRETAGRFMAIMALASEVPKAVAPITAGLLAAIGAGGNYQFVYIAAAVCAVLGGLLVLPIKSVR